MKAINVIVATAIALSLVGCSKSGNSTDSSSSKVVKTEKESYTVLSWEDIPKYLGDSISIKDGKEVEIVGYLTSTISSDKSSGYIWNMEYNSVPTYTTSEDMQAAIDAGTVQKDTLNSKCIPISLEGIDNYANYTKVNKDALSEVTLADGAQYVTVKGVMHTSNRVDAHTVKNDWYLDVDSISVLTEDEYPESLTNYTEYMDSSEWKAYQSCINYIGECCYAWASDSSITEPDVEESSYKYDEILDAWKKNHPDIYKACEKDIKAIDGCYTTVSNCMKEKKRPDDAEGLYNDLSATYLDMLSQIAAFGEIK